MPVFVLLPLLKTPLLLTFTGLKVPKFTVGESPTWVTVFTFVQSLFLPETAAERYREFIKKQHRISYYEQEFRTNISDECRYKRQDDELIIPIIEKIVSYTFKSSNISCHLASIIFMLL